MVWVSSRTGSAFIIGHPSLGRLLRQHLHGLWQDQLAVHALGGQEAHLTRGGEQLIEPLEAAALTIRHPVIAQIAEQNALGTGGDGGHEGGSVHRTVQQRVRLARAHAGLPEIIAVAVLEFAQGLHGGIVHDEHGIPAIGRAQGIEQIHDLIHGNGRGAGRGHAGLCAAGGGQNAQRLARAVAGEKRFFLGSADAPREFAGDIGGHVEGGVIQQLLGHLNHGGQLVGADGHLTEGVVAFGIGAFLVDPRGGAMRGDHGDLALAGRSRNDVGQLSEDVLLLQRVDQGALILIRHQIAALAVGACFQRIENLVGHGLAANGLPERGGVFRGSAARLGLLLFAGLFGDGLICGRIQCRVNGSLTLQSFDLLAQSEHIRLHLVIGRGVLGRNQTVRASLGVQKLLGGVPRLGALFAQLQNSIHKFFLLMRQTRQPLLEVCRAHSVVGFGNTGFQLVQQGIGDGPARKREAVLRRGLRLRLIQDFVAEAQLQRLFRVHPRLAVHEMGQLCAGKAGLDLVCVDDAFLHLVQQLDGPAHFVAVAHGHGQRIVDHHDGHRRHLHLRSSHGDHRSRAGGNAVDAHSDVCRVVHEHIVDLRRGHAVAARRIDPDGNGAAARGQLRLESRRRDLIVEPAFLGNGPFQPQNARVRRGFVPDPVPEFLHLYSLLSGGFFTGEQARVCQLGHVAVDEIEITASFGGDAVEVLQFPDVVGAHPAVLPAHGIAVHARLIIAAQQALHVEPGKIPRLFRGQQQGAVNGLFPAGDPRGERVFHEFQRLLLDVGEGRLVQIAHHVGRHAENARDFVDLEFAGFEELCLLRRNGDGLIAHSLFEDGDTVSVSAALINGVPGIAHALGVFYHARMLQHAARLRAVLIKGRAVFVAGEAHADGLLRHGDGTVADEAVKAQAGNMKNVLRRKNHRGLSAQTFYV
nr:MAG TPA: hypothetical protein [Caudoviricetes sp.]